MANIKSAKKRIKVNETRAARNKSIKSRVKTAIKKVDAAVLSGDKENAKKVLNEAEVIIAQAAGKGVYHKNNSARKISRLTRAVNSLG